MDTMFSMSVIRRAGILIAAAVAATFVPLAASACGAATTAAGTTTNGLEKQSAAEVLQDAAGALQAAKSVHFVATLRGGHVDARMRGGASTGTVTRAGVQVRFTIIGGDGYIKTDRAGLKMMGAPPPVQRQDPGRWVKDPAPASDFTGLTLASLASQLTTYYGPLKPEVRQATLDGRKAVVVSWRNGSKLYVANTGPAYPLRGQFKGQKAGLFDFTDYGAHFHITAPGNPIHPSNTA